MKIYWGDIHNHCSITYGYGSLENALNAAREQLDFASVTGHAMWPDIPERTEKLAFLVDFHNRGFSKLKSNWENVRTLVNEYNEDGKFVTFQSYEMHSRKYGDHHVLSPEEDLPLVYADSPQELISKLNPLKAIAIPHHIAYTPGYRGINWDHFNESISPVVEVYSKHGCSMSDSSDWPYLHTMGPRDTRNTVYAGLQRGHKFSFTASTDHHAGYPGSYRDGRMAVYAQNKTREDIWNAILRGNTYAVSGDKIECFFEINGAVPGDTAHGNVRDISLDIKGRDHIDKVTIYKNAKPFHIINGEFLNKREENSSRKYLIRVETGWGRSEEPFKWEIEAYSRSAAFLSCEPCFCGKSVLSPSKEMEEDENINLLNNRLIENSENNVIWKCTTFKNPSTLHSQTNSVILEVEGNTDSILNFTINQNRIEVSIKDLLESNVTGHMDAYNSEAFIIHRAVPDNLRCIKEYIKDDIILTENDFYHMEIRQVNGQTAWISPIFMK